MKIKLKEYYGNLIIIIELNGKENVVIFCQNVIIILYIFYKELVFKFDEENKRFLIKIVVILIKNDI